MRTTGIFTGFKHKIALKSTTEKATIIPFGDVHYGASLHCARSWAEFQYRCKHTENPYYFGMGDYFDLASTSEREVLADKKLHLTTHETIGQWVDGMVEQYLETIAFMKGRLIGMIEGNHYYQYADGSTSTQRMAQRLKGQYFGVEAHGRIYFNVRSIRKSLRVYAHHGAGSGATRGGSLNRLAQMERGFAADVYLMGHDHQLGTWTGNRVDLDAYSKQVHDPILYVRTGSFLRTRVHGRPSYIVDIAGNPSTLGWASIEVKMQRKEERAPGYLEGAVMDGQRVLRGKDKEKRLKTVSLTREAILHPCL
jgi:hypothetical protein